MLLPSNRMKKDTVRHETDAAHSSELTMLSR